MLKIAVCIVTYKRLFYLKKCLESLQKLKTNRFELSILVIDNDKEQSAKSIVQNISKPQYEIYYVTEEQKGIAYARNKALTAAKEHGTTHLAFIDDDEYADPLWLENIVSFYLLNPMSVISGPVLPDLPDSCPDWIKKGNFFKRKRFKTGTKRHIAGAGNLFFSLELINKHNLKFDTEINTSFGEDELFTRKLSQFNIPIFWVDEAIVYETVLPERLSLAYLIERNYLISSSGIVFYKKLYGLKGVLIGYLKGYCYLLLGLLSLPFFMFRKHKRYQSILYLAKSMGWLCGLFKNKL